jgi:hypothetical protein
VKWEFEEDWSGRRIAHGKKDKARPQKAGLDKRHKKRSVLELTAGANPPDDTKGDGSREPCRAAPQPPGLSYFGWIQTLCDTLLV